MVKRHSPAVKFDPPSLYHPRTIDDRLAMIELVSLDELCKDGKPICVAALHDFTPTKPRSRDLVEAFCPDKRMATPATLRGDRIQTPAFASSLASTFEDSP